jgi:hypothetical protein
MHILATTAEVMKVMGDPLRMVFDPAAGVGGGGVTAGAIFLEDATALTLEEETELDVEA